MMKRPDEMPYEEYCRLRKQINKARKSRLRGIQERHNGLNRADRRKWRDYIIVKRRNIPDAD